MLSFPNNDSIITNPYLAGSIFWVEVVAASSLDAVSTQCHAVAVAAAVVAVAVADMYLGRSSACHQHSPNAGDPDRRLAPCRGDKSLPERPTRAQQ